MSTPREAREYDVVLYGATGFTGRQTVEYFARLAPPGLRWAIAGRRRERLESVRAQAGGPPAARDVLVADSRDRSAIDAMVSRTRVVLSTAGPFAIHGTPVVDACVRLGTDYADITGETAWVREMIARHHDGAAERGIRIVPFCGFDSVPSDLGAHVVARHVRAALGAPCAEVRGYFRLAGGLNGGTIATVLHTLESGRARGLGDPFLLDPPVAHTPRQVRRSQDAVAPRRDPDTGRWVGPFFMAPTNTRVVRRSAALAAQWGEPYGPEFVYQEYLAYGAGPLAPVKAAAGTAGMALFGAALVWRPTRRVLSSRLPRPGMGPSESTMERGWFTCDLLGIAEDGRRVRGRIHHRGDPGNRATVRFACEAALALALDGDRLPGGARRGGVLTPATALGDVLVERLRRAGVTIEVGSYP